VSPMNTSITAEQLKPLTINEIAGVIRKNWKPVNYAAEPYLQAMFSLESINDKYVNDDGRQVVNYFLANAREWRGDVARMVKAELKARVANRA
jgi:hypothetical protein